MKKILTDNELFIFDLDGVVYEGTRPIGHAIESIEKLYVMGKKVAFYTNNATQTPASYARKLCSMGLQVDREQICTSAVVCADSLKSSFPEGSSAFIIGESGLLEAIGEAGFKIINPLYSYDEIIEDKKIRCSFIAAGLDRTICYKKLSAASLLISRGAHFYASNTDSVFPDAHGLLPGAGSLVSFLTTASGGAPKKIFGKPFPEGIYQILKQHNCRKENAIILGDRLDTDVMCGKNAGIHTAVVLTGVATTSDLKKTHRESLPDFVLNDLSEMFR